MKVAWERRQSHKHRSVGLRIPLRGQAGLGTWCCYGGHLVLQPVTSVEIIIHDVCVPSCGAETSTAPRPRATQRTRGHGKQGQGKKLKNCKHNRAVWLLGIAVADRAAWGWAGAVGQHMSIAGASSSVHAWYQPQLLTSYGWQGIALCIDGNYLPWPCKAYHAR